MNELAEMHWRTTEAGAQEADRQSRPTGRWLIGHKLTVASVLMILLTLLGGVVGLWQVLTIGRVIGEAHQKEQQLAWSLELVVAGHRLVGAVDHMLVTQDPLLASTDLPVSLGTLRFYMETLQKAGGETGASDLLEEIQMAHSELLQTVHEVDLLARQELWTEAGLALEQEVRPANEHMGLLIQRLVQQADRDVQAMAARTQAVVRHAALLLAILMALTIAIALGWRHFVFRGLSLSISELRQGVARISSGDLEYKLDVRTGDEIEELGNEFNKMAAELADVIGSLEQRVAERTQALAHRSLQLETAAQISEPASSILDPLELERQVVELIRQRFDYYYVGLFLVDESGEWTSEPGRWAVLRAGTGEAGRQMLEQGHKLEVGGTSMISWCMVNKQARIALDVTVARLRSELGAQGSGEPGGESVRFDNPLLPETRSELALPLISRGQAIGALTIQSSQEAAFSEEDVAVLQTMANQLANAIANAQLYDRAQREIAERKRVEEALRRSEEKYRTILASIEDGYYEVDIEGSLTFFNDSLCKLYKYPADELMGMNYRQYMDHEAAKQVYQTFNEVYQTGKPTRAFGWEVIKRDGARGFVEVSVSLISGSTGEPAGFRGIVRDITERKAVEEALRVKDSALASSINAIAISDLSRNLTYVNPSFLNLWGYNDDKEVLGRPTAEFWQTEKKVVGVLEALGYMRGWIRELVAIRRDGSLFDVQLAESMVTDEAGKAICMMGSFVDITERKRAEAALKEYSERLEEMVEERTKELRDAQEQLIRKEKLAILGQLAGAVSHELRNPLGAIKNSAYFLNMVLEDPEPEVKETLGILDKEVAISERVISSLLDFARTKLPTRRKVDLSAVIQEALSRAAVPENIEVVSQLDGMLPIMLADPDQLAQVFGNIILNAVQAMSEGGRLVVKSEVCTPEWVAVSFADTGVGIPKENLDKLFEPLFTTKAKGVGLGLALTKTLVEGHGGTIEVESEVGKGTTFQVKLPISAG